MIGYRLIHLQSIIRPRSYCIHCKHTLSWYDNVPLISYILLCGRCRYCEKPISVLYPFIEAVTVGIMFALFSQIEHRYWLAYFIFFSALIVTIRSDLESMLISRFATICLIPFGYLFSTLGLLPISLSQSILGSIFGYMVLLGTASLFSWITHKQGMGLGDLEMLAFIGSFIGVWGCWITLMLASTIGALLGIAYIVLFRKKSSLKIPFGPFLAVGATLFILYQQTLIPLLFFTF